MITKDDIKVRRRYVERNVYRVDATITFPYQGIINTAALSCGIEGGYKIAEYNAKAALLTKLYGDIQDAIQDLADEYRNDIVGDDLLDILELIDER